MKLNRLLAPVLTLFVAVSAKAEDWGTYSIVPVSAQAMVLEAVESGTMDGTAVSISKPTNKPNQRWMIAPKDDGFFVIKPSHSQALALSAAQGGTKNGTAIVLETDGGKPSQLWAMTKHENGSYSLTPKHAPAMGIDDLGGKQDPGARSTYGLITRRIRICSGSSSHWQAAALPRQLSMPCRSTSPPRSSPRISCPA